jgi:hypothetical protein
MEKDDRGIKRLGYREREEITVKTSGKRIIRTAQDRRVKK